MSIIVETPEQIYTLISGDQLHADLNVLGLSIPLRYTISSYGRTYTCTYEYPQGQVFPEHGVGWGGLTFHEYLTKLFNEETADGILAELRRLLKIHPQEL